MSGPPDERTGSGPTAEPAEEPAAIEAATSVAAADLVPTEPASTGEDALDDLRALRRGKRLQQQEWFELAYRAYIAGICWFAGAFALAAIVGDETFTPEQRADVVAHAPAVGGMVVAGVVAMALRAGARGGPLSVEPGDVAHLLLAPVPRAAVLRRPAVQQMRLAALSGVAAGAVVGVLLARRLDEPSAAWVLAAALATTAATVAYVAVALLAHAARMRGWQATTLGLVLVVWQALSLPADSAVPGPFDHVGHLVLWGEEVQWADLLALVVIALTAVAALAVLERLSVEALDRRSALVTQLRFAVTMRDLRTVVLLRRQLTNEQHRNRPWVGLPARIRFPVARRDVRGFAHFPLSRIGRMTVLTGVAAAAQVAAYRGTTPAVFVSGLAAFVLGLECLEGFAQETDLPDVGGLTPHSRGWLLVRHLPAPAVLALAFAMPAAVVVAVALGAGSSGWQLALLLSVPVALAGVAGAVLNTIAGVPPPITPGSVDELLPPEIAGFREGIRTLWPLAVAISGSLPVLAARAAVDGGDEALPPALQATVGVGLVLAAVAWWARKRDDVRTKFSQLWQAGSVEFEARHGVQR